MRTRTASLDVSVPGFGTLLGGRLPGCRRASSLEPLSIRCETHSTDPFRPGHEPAHPVSVYRPTVVSTSLTDLVACKHPIQQAVMGGISGMHLASAVANAGGVGMMHHWAPVALDERLGWMRANTRGVWGVGFRADTIDKTRDRLEMVLASRAPIVEFCWDDPDPDLVAKVHSEDALVFWQLGAVETARMARDAGVDVVIAQGNEAGGHLAGDIPVTDLLESVLGIVDGPVIVAGGIGTGADIADFLRNGAAGARLGTVFVACPESDASDAYRTALVAAGSSDLVVTTAFGTEWPDAPHRVIRSCLQNAERLDIDPVGVYDDGVDKFDIPRFSTLAPTRFSSGPHEAMAMYAGLGVDHLVKIESAAEVVDRLVTEMNESLPG